MKIFFGYRTNGGEYSDVGITCGVIIAETTAISHRFNIYK